MEAAAAVVVVVVVVRCEVGREVRAWVEAAVLRPQGKGEDEMAALAVTGGRERLPLRTGQAPPHNKHDKLSRSLPT